MIEVPKPRFAADAPIDGEFAAKSDQSVAESLFVGGFGGYHPGVINVNFADGSTRALAETIDRDVLRLLGNRADGEIVKPF
jgi:prepilin-type processing-associated H-X9-DG protein